MPQSYYLGGQIRAADFNLFANDINDIVGIGANDSGYGQSHLVVTNAVVGGDITASLWDELLTSMLYASRHQGTTITVPTSTSDAGWPTVGNIISILPTVVADIATIVSNKLNSDISYMTADANKISDSSTFYDPNGTPPNNTPTWTNIDQVFYEAKVSFTDADARRHFFNSGGEIRFDAVLNAVDGSHAQSVDWQNLLSVIATVKLSHSSTESSAGVGTPGVGFNNLTTSYANIYTKGGTGDYSGNQLNIEAKLNGTADIDVKVKFDDAHPADTGTWSNPPYSGSWTGTDYVAGALTVTLDEFRPSDSPYGVSLPSPTYSTISSL